MAEQLSPIGSAWKPGSHGHFADGTGVSLAETRPGSIVQVSAWPATAGAVVAAISAATALKLGSEPGAGAFVERYSAFGIGPGRFLVVDQAEGLADTLAAAIGPESGAVTDLSHGRTAIRIEGSRAEWVLAKLYAIDFARTAFPVGAGRATLHHDIATLIQRTGPDRFDLYVFRSFARSFWEMLCHAADDVGYVVK